MIDVVGLLVLLIFYAAILATGLLATYWYKKHVLHNAAESHEVSLVAGRKLGNFVGIFTMTATTVGGGYINGTAESIATAGLAWTLAPFGICAGLTIGGIVFAKHMHNKHYLTMYDPLQQRYGNVMVALLYMAGICGDVFWSGSVLAALGTSLSVVINIDVTMAIVMSAVVALIYTVFGQVVSVAYTDVIQLIFITVGLVLAVPFVFTHPAVSSEAMTSDLWLGEIHPSSVASWLDLLIAMTFGTIPWQTYFQRVLSVKTAKYAQILSIAGGFGAFLLAIPSVLIGIASFGTDWNQTSLGMSPLDNGQAALILPLSIKYLTPRPVSLLGLAAIAAAVMSSVDSAILSSASVFTHNIYKMVLRAKASERELVWVQRLAVVVVGMIATLMAIFVTSIYGMFILAADIIFVIMFPQLVAVLFISVANTYGAMFGFLVGSTLRLVAGEPYLSLPALMHYPFYDAKMGKQEFPFRTFTVVATFLLIILTSYIASRIFSRIPLKYDVFGCFKQQHMPAFSLEGVASDDQVLAEQSNVNSTHSDLNMDNCTTKEITSHHCLLSGKAVNLS